MMRWGDVVQGGGVVLAVEQIYGTYNRAVLKVVPTLQTYAEPLTDAMVVFYLASQKRFTTDIQSTVACLL